MAYDKTGDPDRAIVDYTKAIRLKPNFANAYTNRGGAYHDKGEHARAIVDFDAVIDLQPESALAYYYRGMMWLHLREREKAKADLTIAKEKGIEQHGIQLPTDLAAMLPPQQ